MTTIAATNPISSTNNTANLNNLNTDKLEKPSETWTAGALVFEDTATPNAATAPTKLIWSTTDNKLTIGAATSDASALLELISTTQGIGFPSMTTTQRDAISSPATGLQIHNTTTGSPDYYDGSSWIQLASGAGLTQGSVTFIGVGGTQTEDNANFFWDDTANELGLLTNTPSQTLDINGNFTVAGATGNTVIGGTLGVTGATTLSSTLDVTGNFDVNSGNFTVAAASGNTVALGTLDVTLAINTNEHYEIDSAKVLHIKGSDNVFVGGATGGSGAVGNDNTGVGDNALNALGTGNNNTAIGSGAGNLITTGSGSVIVGHQSSTGSMGSNNTIVGTLAASGLSGSDNCYFGSNSGALQGTQTAANNCYFGRTAGYSTSSGGNNVGVGFEAGRSNSTGTGNIFLGYQSGYNETGSDKLYIDNSNTTTPLIYGNFSTNDLIVYGSLDVGVAESGTPGTTGPFLGITAKTFTDNNTAGSGTAASFVANSIAVPTLAATNSSVTTTDAATFYIAGVPVAGTNETITNAYSMWIDAGDVRFDGSVMLQGGTIYGDTSASGDLTFQSTSHATKDKIYFGDANGMVYDELNKRLSLGSDTTTMTIGGTAKTHVFSSHSTGGGDAYDVTFHRHSATSGAFLAGARSRGSEASPSIVSDNDNLLDIYGVGFDGTDYAYAAGIQFEVDGTPSDGTDMPGRLVFLTTPDGSGTLAEVLRLDSAKLATFASNIDVKGGSITNTTGAITITSASAGNISLTPNSTGNVVLGSFTLDADQTVGAGQDNYVFTYDDASGLISLEAAAGGGLSNIVEDTTPQLGGMLDVNTYSLGDGTLELLSFVETGSAVNEFTITNAATGNAPIFSATGDDTNIGITITPKGSGALVLDGLSWPTADGTVNQVLETDGSGNLGWVTSSSSQWTTSGSDIYYTTGNISVGSSTFESWHPDWSVMQLGGTIALVASAATGANKALNIVQNAYYDATDVRWEYRETDEACKIQVGTSGQIKLQTTASGTADTAITWTDALTVNVDGTVTIPNINGNTVFDADIDVQGGDIQNTIGALTLTPASGSNLDIVCAGAGDFAINTDDFYIDSSTNNIGIGVTALEAWSSAYTAIQLGGNASLIADRAAGITKAVILLQNAYHDGSWKYQNTDEASLLSMNSGLIKLKCAASGTADTAITWNTGLQIQSDGSLLALPMYSDVVGGTNRDVYVDNTGLIGYVSSSERYKKNIVDMSDTSWIYDLRPVEYDRKKCETHEFGLIAEEVAEVQEYLITRDEEGRPESVEYSRLIPILLHEIQSLKQTVERLK